MCTAVTFNTKDNSYFGRNMDIDYSFNQSVQLLPKGYKTRLVADDREIELKTPIMGMGTEIFNTVAFAEGFNGAGLACAGLNFPDYAQYTKENIQGKTNVAPCDIILWVLACFEKVEQVKKAVKSLNIVNKSIGESIPIPLLHWIVADATESIVIEQTAMGLRVFENPVGVLTNAPTFDWHMTNLQQYMSASPQNPRTIKWGEQYLNPLGQGLGTAVLPGDFSPPARFVRAAFLRANSASQPNEEAVSQFFHILDGVKMVKGSVITKEGRDDITLYQSCISLVDKIYYYKTYNNSRITAIRMDVNYVGEPKSYPYNQSQDILFQR